MSEAAIKDAVKNSVNSFLEEVKKGLKDEKLGSDETWTDGVMELVDLLKSYQEEGKELRPEFVVFRKSDHDEIGLKLLPEVLHMFEIAESVKSVETFRDAVKTCAPLAQGVWAGFIKVCDSNIAYGVMRRRTGATNERVFDKKVNEMPPYVLVRQLERHVVELAYNGQKEQISFRVGQQQEAGSSSHQARERLLECLTESIVDGRTEVRAFLEDVFDRALSNGHGFLVAVTHHAQTTSGSFRNAALGLHFKTWKIPTLIKVGQTKNSDELAQLMAWSELISSLLMSDGITWFDDEGSVLGYRMFIKSDDNTPGGGARTRAFQALEKLVENGNIKAAFMQSQDGRARFR